MQQGEPFLHVAQVKALFQFTYICAAAVIGEQQVDDAAPYANRDNEMLRVPVAPRVGHALLHDAVEHFLLVGPQAFRPA